MGFSAAEVSRLAGFEKPWMLNHLEREEIFVREAGPRAHHGKNKVYTFRDLLILRAINRLLSIGARPKRIKTSISTFMAVCPPLDTNDALLAFAHATGRFVVTPAEVIFCQSDHQLIDLAANGQLAFAFMLDSASALSPSLNAAIAYDRYCETKGVRDLRELEKIAREHGL